MVFCLFVFSSWYSRKAKLRLKVTTHGRDDILFKNNTLGKEEKLMFRVTILQYLNVQFSTIIKRSHKETRLWFIQREQN